MSDTRHNPVRVPRRPAHLGTRLYRGWARSADWLGAQRPLDLSLGAVALMALVMVIAHLF